MNPPDMCTKAESTEAYWKNSEGMAAPDSGIIPEGESGGNPGMLLKDGATGNPEMLLKGVAAGTPGMLLKGGTTGAPEMLLKGGTAENSGKKEEGRLHILENSATDTFGRTVHSAEQYLRGCGIADAAADAWLLLEYITGMNRALLLAELRTPFPEKWKQLYSELLEARGSHIPLQYLTGEQEFMGLDFRVTPDVLIPRQDTETLVEEALAWMKKNLAAEPYDGKSAQKRSRPGSISRPVQTCSGAMSAQNEIAEQDFSAWLPEKNQPRPYRILDLCTGSGCIAISLAKSEKTKIEIWASDISAAALAVAAENAARLNAAVNFAESDLFAALDPALPFDLIVSNPPYITEGEMETLDAEVRLHEPRAALYGGRDGLDFYRKIIRESRTYLRPQGCLMFEIGYAQGRAVTELMRENGFSEVWVRQDLSGKDRVAAGALLS